MFTGIVEEVGKVLDVESSDGNLLFTIHCTFTNELKIDQSVAHNGVCLTIVGLEKEQQWYKVTAVKETLQKTNLQQLDKGSSVNLERAMKFNGRVDGHIVQGHVDQVIECHSIKELEGSWVCTFKFNSVDAGYLIEKGSVTLNGVSLTLFDVQSDLFSVTIIPYTLEHTTFNQLKAGDKVNVEFDVIGKYVGKQLGLLKKQL